MSVSSIEDFSDWEIKEEYSHRNLYDQPTDDQIRDEFFCRDLGQPIEDDELQILSTIVEKLNRGLDQTPEMISLIEKLSGTLIAPRKS
jgi:hypothetical protein